MQRLHALHRTHQQAVGDENIAHRLDLRLRQVGLGLQARGEVKDRPIDSLDASLVQLIDVDRNGLAFAQQTVP